MYNFGLPPNDPESKDEEEDELHEENLAPANAPAPTPAHVLVPTPHPRAPHPCAPMSVDDTADDAMAVDMVLPVTEQDVSTAFAVPVSAASHIVGTSSGTPENTTPTIQGHLSTIVGSSSATVRSSAVPTSSSSATVRLSTVPTSSSSAAAATLFAEGVTDSKFNARPSDEELAESEPSVEEMIQRVPLFCTQLIAMLHELDSWSSLMEHHTNARKSKEDAFLITRKDSEILSEFLDEFQDGDGEIRTKIIANAMAAVFLARPDGDPFNKSEASKKIRKWFYNCYDRPERQYVKFIQKWSARNAYYHMCRDEVMTEAEEMSGDLPGSRAFMGSLQDATTKLWKNISDEERLNGQFFHCVVLTAHKHEDEQVTATLFEADKPNDTQQSFLSFCPNWKNAPLFKEWQSYAKKCYNADNVQNTPKDRSTTNKMPIHIPIKADGCPEVPNITLNDSYKTKTVQVMLHEYLTTHIRILGYVSGKQRARISWGELSAKPSTWINPECSPIGFTWADPSKICIGDIHQLLEHWYGRKRQHLTPLIWAETCPVLKDATLSSEERQDYCSDGSSDDNSGRSAVHGSKNTTHTSEEPQESSTSSVTPSEFNFNEEWGGLDVDSQMNSLQIGPTHLTEERLEPLQYNQTPTESIVGSGSDRGGPLASPLEFGLRLNTSGKDDTGSYDGEGNQSLSEEPVEILDLPKHKIKLTEKAR
ncbi:hypothetical protein V8E53_006200 [Lactarius tabidus]